MLTQTSRLFKRLRPCISLLALCALSANAQTVVHTAAQTDTAPKYVAVNGAIVGMCVDLDRALEKAAPGLRFAGDQDWVPASRIDVELAAGRLDSACAISKTPARLENFRFVDPPLFSSDYVLIARADDAVAVRGWDDVLALREAGVLLVDHGFGPVSRLRSLGLTVDDGALGVKNNLLKLRAGRARFYFHRSLGLNDEMERSGMAGEFRVLPTVMDVQPFYLVFGRHVAPDTVEQARRGMEKLSASGELKRIVRKWSGKAASSAAP